MSPIYRREPISNFDGIPIFCTQDRYTENYDRIAGDHIAVSPDGDTNPFIDEQVWDWLEESTESLVARYAPAGASIVDVGVGTARLLSRFPDFRRYGVDISLAYLALARGKGVDVCLARAEDLPYRDEMFDVVISTDMLEHVLDLYRTVGELFRILKPGGHLIVRVPYRENLAGYLTDDYPYEFAHLRSFDEHSLQLQLCRAFPGIFVEFALVRALVASKLRLQLPRGSSFLTRKLQGLVHCIPSLRSPLVRLLYQALDINMVVRKPETMMNGAIDASSKPSSVDQGLTDARTSRRDTMNREPAWRAQEYSR